MLLTKDTNKHDSTSREWLQLRMDMLTDIAKVLIQNGADVNAVDKETGHTSLRS